MPITEVIRTAEYTSSDPRQYRYWSKTAQPYATGDQLARRLRSGWTMDTKVAVETHWFGEARHILVYHIKLCRGNQEVIMPVVGNPFTQELVADPRLGVNLVPYQKPSADIKFAVVAR